MVADFFKKYQKIERVKFIKKLSESNKDLLQPHSLRERLHKHLKKLQYNRKVTDQLVKQTNGSNSPKGELQFEEFDRPLS